MSLIRGKPRVAEEFLRTSRRSSPLHAGFFTFKSAREMSSESPQLDSAASVPDTGTWNASQEANGAKRKAEQSNGAHMRSKRNRYISIAWCVYFFYVVVDDGRGCTGY